MNRKFGSPSAAAPRRSAWIAMRLRSRPVTWTIGSTPASRTSTAAGMAAIATFARLLSVTFAASTTPLSTSARRRTTDAAALLGGLSSAVRTNSPWRRSDSKDAKGHDPFHLSLSSKDGSGTAAGLRRLPRRQRAVPSASLDESARRRMYHVYWQHSHDSTDRRADVAC